MTSRTVQGAATVVRPEPMMPAFYLIVATLLLASLGLLQLSTYPHVPLVAPTAGTLGALGADRR